MDIMELGAIGELVGGLAVIGSLIYLGLQVRQSNSLARAEAEMRSVVSAAEFNTLLASDAEVSALWHRGLRNREPLELEDRDRFGLLLSNAFFRVEAVFFNYQRGFVVETSWLEWEKMIQNTLLNPPANDWWTTARVPFSVEFRRRVDAIREQAPLADSARARP